VSVERAGTVLAGLRRTRSQQRTLVRSLYVLTPPLLALFVVAAWFAHPSPALSGMGLAVSVAMAAFVVGVFGRNATAERPGAVHIVFVAVIVVSAAVLTWLQPDGPGPECVLLGVVCVARLLPDRIAVSLLVVVFVAAVVIAMVAGRDDLAVLAALAAFYGMLYLAFRLSEASRRAERLVVDLERSRAAEAEAAGLAERQRLAREMHDVLAHSLSGLILQLEGARMLAAADPADPRLVGAIERAHQLGRSGLDEARRAIGMLRDDELPGPERLPGLAAEFERTSGVPCTVTVLGEPRGLGSEVGLAFYRVAQEALTNITKHARAERVQLCLDYGPSSARLVVEDVGEAPQVAGLGYGLTGMRERAELLGGTLTAAATSSGFRVELEVPT
jgi:signal transduction histidine kinase